MRDADILITIELFVRRCKARAKRDTQPILSLERAIEKELTLIRKEILANADPPSAHSAKASTSNPS